MELKHHFIKSEEVDLYIRKILKDNDIPTLAAVKAFTQTLHILDGFILRAGVSKQLIELLETLPEEMKIIFASSLMLSRDIAYGVADTGKAIDAGS